MACSLTTNTINNLLLDNAVIQLNYTTTAPITLGATRGGASFTIERDIKSVEVDGMKGEVKGLRRIVGERAQITGVLIEHGSTIYTSVLAGLTSSATTEGYDKLTSDTTITDGDYLTDVAIVGNVSGSTVDLVCIIYNALGDGNFSLETVDKEETGYEVQFTGHYSSTDLCTAPYEIRYPN